MPDTKISQLTELTALSADDLFAVVDAPGTAPASRKITAATLAAFLFTRIAGASGAAGEYITLQRLTANTSDITVTTPTVVMTTTGLSAGVWHYRYVVLYQTAATTTGISFVTNFTGTVTRYVKNWFHITTGGAASTGIGDNVADVNSGQIVEGHSTNVNNQDEGPTAGVATANADIMAIVEGFFVATTSGNLELKIRSEVAASAVRLMAGSFLYLTKVA